MVGVNMKIEGISEVSNRIKEMKQSLRIERRKAIENSSVYLMNYIQDKKLSGQVLKRRTARLADSIGYKVEEKGTSFIGGVGTPVVYSVIHETGGTIRAKNAKYLTIPLSDAMTPAGVVRKPARQWADTFVRKIRNNLFIFSKESGSPVPIFLLKKSVNIPKRPYIKPALQETKDKIFEMIGEAVKISVKIANGEK